MIPLPPLSDLELLARHAPTIYGRALDPDRPTLTPQPMNGRPDWVDGRSAELGRAVGALRALLALDAEGPEGRRTAGVLWLVHVLCGTGAAPRAYVLASSLYGRLAPLPPEPPLPPTRGKRTGKEVREGDRRARAVHDAWERAARARSAEGLVLYVAARQLWEARVQRRTG
jgi:hypothetical protein